MKMKKNTGLLVGLAGTFIILTILQQNPSVTTIDTNILLVISKIRTEFLTEAMLFLSYIGTWHVHIWIVGVICFYFLVKKRYSIIVLLIFNLYGSRFFNQFLKMMIMRERPSIRMIDVTEYSFPSGHAMNNFSLFGFLLFLVLVSRMKKTIKVVTSIFLALLILSISFSRLYLAVHYPTDILAGWCGGGLVVWMCVYLFKRFQMKR